MRHYARCRSAGSTRQWWRRRLKARAIHDYTAGEDTDVFADSIVPEVSLKWALTGDADVYADEAAAYDSLDAGTAQAEIRRFAAELGAAKRRVLVTTIPTAGDGRGGWSRSATRIWRR